MINQRTAPILLALLGLALGCSDDDDGNDRDAATEEPLSLSVVTFNMALTTTTKGPAERFPEILSALAETGADVLCLQEAFNVVKSPAEVADALAATYPYAFFSSIPDETRWGSGVLLVSKHPLLAGDALRFVNEDALGVVDRTALSAELALDGRTFRVACTHLSAGLGAAGVALRGEQLDEIFAWLDGKPAVDGPTLLLGDFNMGPDPVGACTPDTVPKCVLPDTTNYDLVLSRFEDPNATLAECTQCKQQFDALQALPLFSDEPDQRIDHCFVKDLAPYVHTKSEIVLADEVAIEADGELLSHLSDHRGVRCDFAEAD